MHVMNMWQFPSKKWLNRTIMLKPISNTEYIFRFLNQNEFIETCDRRYLEPARLIGVNIISEIVFSLGGGEGVRSGNVSGWGAKHVVSRIYIVCEYLKNKPNKLNKIVSSRLLNQTYFRYYSIYIVYGIYTFAQISFSFFL